MPATIPYNQTHDSHTGGSYNSSDRGSSSTSGKRVGEGSRKQFLKLFMSQSCFLFNLTAKVFYKHIIVVNHIIPYTPALLENLSFTLKQ